MESSFLNDIKERIDLAQQNNQLTENAKLILWGEALQASGFGRITLNDVEELERMMNLDTTKYWKDFEIATFGVTQ